MGEQKQRARRGAPQQTDPRALARRIIVFVWHCCLVAGGQGWSFRTGNARSRLRRFFCSPPWLGEPEDATIVCERV